MARRSDGLEMYTGNEGALTVDGALSTKVSASVVRLQYYSVTGNTAVARELYAYETGVIHPHSFNMGTGGDQSGFVDPVVLPDVRLVSLERSLEPGLPPFGNWMYELDFTGATDGSGLGVLNGETFNLV